MVLQKADAEQSNSLINYGYTKLSLSYMRYGALQQSKVLNLVFDVQRAQKETKICIYFIEDRIKLSC